MHTYENIYVIVEIYNIIVYICRRCVQSVSTCPLHMRVRVCVYIYIHVFIQRIYVYIHMYAHIYRYVYNCANAVRPMCEHSSSSSHVTYVIYIQVYIRTYSHTHREISHIFEYMCVRCASMCLLRIMSNMFCIYLFKYTHIFMYIYIYIYINTYT